MPFCAVLEVEDFVSDGDIVLFQPSLAFYLFRYSVISYVTLKYVEYIIVTKTAALKKLSERKKNTVRHP